MSDIKIAKNHGHLWGRRDLVTRAGWFATLATLAVATGGFVRLLFRRAPLEPPSVFHAGTIADYQPGKVSDRFVRAWRVFIVHDGERLFALQAKCTHLGCTPRWYGLETKFKCPCHGSGFHADGVNFEGPAPRPLERVKIWQDSAGQIWADVDKRFEYPRRDVPDAFVAVRGGGKASG